MIATGGLLRINARRQDSLRAKAHKAHTHKRTNKKKRSEVVVVKGKLKLVSVSGLVAAFGIVILLVGMIMATLGYWPRDGLFFTAQPTEGTTLASVSSGSSAAAPVDTQGEEKEKEPEGNEEFNRSGGEEAKGGHEEKRGGVDGLIGTEINNGTTGHVPPGLLEDFLDRYLYSDRLKVFGPLIMGIGIFLFICANAVLHENRDKKTKVINLRDIYSTVIDLHSLRKPNASSANPLNGLVNYIQSKSLESKPRAYPASLMSRREGGGGDGGDGRLSKESLLGSSSGEGGVDEGERDTVFSIYQESRETPPTSLSSHRLSLPLSFSPQDLPTCWTAVEKEVPSSFTLPLRRQRLPAPHRRHSARDGTEWSGATGIEECERERGGHSQEEEEERSASPPPPPLSSSTPPTLRPIQCSCSSSSLHREAPGGSPDLLLLSSSSLAPSHQSFSSLSHLLSSSSSTLRPPPCRRCSLPTTSSSMTGYSKLAHAEGESFESTEMTSSHHVTSHRKFSNREKLRMISQVDSVSRQEEEEEGAEEEEEEES